MKSRKFLLGLTVLALLALLTVVTAVLEHPWLPTAGLALLLTVVGAIALDTNKRTRSRYGARPVAAQASAPVTSEEDLMGTIRLLQAQYVGRLDRAQDSLELATTALLAAAEDRDRPRAAQQ